MKHKVNFHLHSTGSDGKLEPEEVIKQSIKAGLKFICFTDHHIFPKVLSKKYHGWGACHHKEAYYKDVLRLKKKYADKIWIGYGVEMDWFDNYQSFTKKQIKTRPFDFVLGSIHVLELPGGESIYVNAKMNVDDLIKKYGIKKLVNAYYGSLRNLINSGLFDSVAHFDLIKIKNADEVLFSEKADWYVKDVLNTLDVLQNSGICLELNTGAKRMILKDNYPSDWVLKEAFKRKIPITIGSDGHRSVNEYLEEGYKLAKKVGYKSVMIFKNRKRREFPI